MSHRVSPHVLVRKSLERGSRVLAALLFAVGLLIGNPAPTSAAACVAPTTDFGTATSTVSVPTTGTYRTWSRIMAPDATNNSYLLEVDGNTCFVVGDGAINANTWTWVDYQNAATASKINLTLSAGSHTIKLIGREADVKIDRLLFVADQGCVPVGVGDNCTQAADLTPPTVTMTTPADGTTVSGGVNVTATANDDTGVSKVEFYVNSVLKSTSTSAPYSYSWDTLPLANGPYSVMAKAYDANGNVAADTNQVTVQNNDTQAPTAPAGLSATAAAYNRVNLSWQPSTDNVGVKGYWIIRNGVTIGQVATVTSYSDTGVAPNTQYSYRLVAFDAAGNNSVASTAATATTPKTPDTQAPTAPATVQATAVSSSQVNLSWQPSTDNIGVTAYDIYRSTSTVSASKIATVTTTSFGDGGLSPSTTYSYYVIARDAAGNSSPQSTTANATTAAAPVPVNTGVLRGRITNNQGQPIGSARVVIWVNSIKQIHTANADGQYLIVNLPPKTYTVKYRARGYNAQSFTLKISAGQVVTKDVQLRRR